MIDHGASLPTILSTPVHEERKEQEGFSSSPQDQKAPILITPQPDTKMGQEGFTPPPANVILPEQEGFMPYQGNDLSILLNDKGNDNYKLLKKFKTLYGANPRKIRKKGESIRVNTEIEGGIEKFVDIFEKLTGRKMNLEGDQEIQKHFRINFRLHSKTGNPKLEITDVLSDTFEKITLR